ncbi:MAG TPA: hypothetical protein VD835_10925, partial [Pyrinomonadaceae bacterium]|nr:hypothetical protein [Pyrinomonadaceae bacterium]
SAVLTTRGSSSGVAGGVGCGAAVRAGFVARRDGRLRCCDCASNAPHTSADNKANVATKLYPERLRIIKLLADCCLSVVSCQLLVAFN